jgi:excisionase family DNA binding protein
VLTLEAKYPPWQRFGRPEICGRFSAAYSVAMNATDGLSFDLLLEALAEKLAAKLSQDPSRLYPRLMTVDQAAVYLGRTREAVQHLVGSGKLPTVRADRRVFLDRLDLDKWIDEHKTGWV